MQRNKNFCDIPLFYGFSEDDLSELFGLIEAEKVIYEAKKNILHEGDLNPYICVILSGEAIAVKYEMSGRETIFTRLIRGSIFGYMLAVLTNRESPVTIKAFAKTEILRFRFNNLVTVNKKNSELITRLLKNLTVELAQKFFNLQDRVNCLICPTMREKIMTYLNCEVKCKKGIYFDITMNREQLAAYLNTDRSALSRELSNLKKEGIIDFHKNSFRIIKERG